MLTALNEVYWNIESTEACLRSYTNSFCAILEMSGSDKENVSRSDICFPFLWTFCAILVVTTNNLSVANVFLYFINGSLIDSVV